MSEAPACPYPGLEPFSDDYAELFFGRETATKQVVQTLLAHSVSILCGPSGVGKSSLLRVGVLPAIARLDEDEDEDEDGPGDGRFYAAILCAKWAGKPSAEVRACLVRTLPQEQAAALREAPLADVLVAVASHAGGRVLLILDQFEEQFATGGEPDWELARAIATAPSAVHVLIAVRDDALAQLDRFAEAIPGLLDNLRRLDHLDMEAACQAIVRPAKRWNEISRSADRIKLETPVVDAVLAGARMADDGADRVQPAYLQLVMRRLWLDAAAGGCAIDLRLLEARGGTDGIVASHVDDAMAGWSRDDQRVADAMLDYLVTPSGAKVAHSAADLAQHAAVSERDAERVLARLGDRRILERLEDGRYQLHHDTLARPLLDWRRRWAQEQVRRSGWRRLLGVMAFVTVLLVAATAVHAFEPLESSTVDARFELRGPRTPPRDIVIVAVDEPSRERLDVDWPVPRSQLGDAIDWIAEGYPKAIAFDGDLNYRDRQDESLAGAINGSAHGRVVLAAEATSPDGDTNVFGGSEVLRELGAQAGFAGFLRDVNGVIHHPVYGVDGVDSFAVATAALATGRPVARDGLDDAWIDYYGPNHTLRSVSYWKVVKRRVDKDYFRDKIVVIGATSPAYDRPHPVWGVSHDELSDVELQATAIDTIRRDLPLTSPPWWVTFATIIAGALLPALLLARRLSLAATLAISLAAAGLYLAVAYATFAIFGLMLTVVEPLAALLIADLAVVLLSAVPPAERRRPRMPRAPATLLLTLALTGTLVGSASAASFAADPIVQLGAKLDVSDGTPFGMLGTSAAISADGHTALVGGPDDDDGAGAAWVFVKQGSRWVQQGPKLVPDDGDEGSEVGISVALSADGSTALLGGFGDDEEHGAAWVFTRNAGKWSQQGPKLLPTDPSLVSDEVLFGNSVALSADGSTALVGGFGDGGGYGAAWAFTRSGGLWTQQGPKLTVPGEMLGSDGTYSWFGSALALAADGDTALIGGERDMDGLGAAWVFTRAGGSWTQDAKLTADDEAGLARFGRAVALSGDGSTALVGGEEDTAAVGAAWAFARDAGAWTQQGSKLTGPDEEGEGHFGSAVALDATGDDALVGGRSDSDELGAVWPFVRSGEDWAPQGAKLVPSDTVDDLVSFGSAVALSADATTLLLGGNEDNSGNGAAWMFAPADAPLTLPTLSISPGAANSPDGIWDNAELFDGDDPTGSLTFRLYGPNAEDCTDRPAATLTVPVAGNDFYSTGGRLTVRAPGSYLDVVSYSGDARNAALSTMCGESQVDVLLQPTLRVAVDGSREVGSTLHMTSSLQGGDAPSGTLDVALFGPSDPTCGEPLLSQILPVAGGRAPSIDYVPLAAGTYRLEASYSGDARNLPTDRFCDDPAVEIAVERAAPALSLTTSAPAPVGSPLAATAHIAGGADPSGIVRFVLFPPSGGCAGPEVAVVRARLDGRTASSGSFATRIAGTYRFVASYEGDARNREVQTGCDAGMVVRATRHPTLRTSARGEPTSAGDGTGTITEYVVMVGGFDPTGTLSFDVFGPGDPHCHGRTAFDSDQALTTTEGSEVMGGLAPGRYTVVARYGGDTNNEAVKTPCGAARALVPPAARAKLARIASAGAGVLARIACTGRSVQRCAGALRLTAGPRSRPVVVGRRDYGLGVGRAKSVRVAFNAVGRRMRRNSGDLPLDVLLLANRPRGLRLLGRRHLVLAGSTR